MSRTFRVFRRLVIPICIVSAMATAAAGEEENESAASERYDRELAAINKLYGPAGKRHIIASIVCRDGDKMRLFTLQRLDLWLINANYGSRQPYPAPHVRGSLAYMVVESDPQEPVHEKLLWLQYDGRPASLGDLLCELAYDPAKGSLYIVRHNRGPFPRFRVDRVDVNHTGGEIPTFDPSERDKWPAPSVSAMSSTVGIRMRGDIDIKSLTPVCEDRYLLICGRALMGRAEGSIFCRLDLMTSKWYELAITMKEVEEMYPLNRPWRPGE